MNGIKSVLSKVDFWDVLFVSGLVALLCGLWQWWEPSAFIVGGSVAMWLGLKGARAK